MLLRTFIRLIGFLILIYGIYLIFNAQVFLGVVAIIIAFLIFPNRRSTNHHHDHDYTSNDSSYSSSSDAAGGDSGEGGD
jgi:uncharacterized membrane protein